MRNSIYVYSLLLTMIRAYHHSSIFTFYRTTARHCTATHAHQDSANMKVNFYNTGESEFKELMKQWGQPSFRVKQVRQWVYEKGVLNFDDMKDLPVALRTQLSNFYSIGSLHLASEQVSKDGTKKRAYELHDRQLIESVLMPYEDGRNTACISSQAGCAMGCVFCATGQMGFFRQLTSTEIFEQAQRFSAELKVNSSRLSNVVMMGMYSAFQFARRFF